MQEILFPILTGLTLVFAGILVGYFLWFRDRSEQLILSQQLTTDNERLSAELRGQTVRCNEFDDQVSRLEQKNTSMQQLCDDLLGSREQVYSQVSELEMELNSSRSKLDQAREQLLEECRTRAGMEENLHLAKQQHLDTVTSLDGEWNAKFCESQSLLTERQHFVDQLNRKNEQLAERLHLSNSETAELKSELDAQRQILELAKANAVGLEKEYVTLETTMRSQIELLNESRGQTAAAASARKLAGDEISESRTQIQDLQNQLRKLEADTASSEKLKNRCDHLESNLRSEKERLVSANAQLDEIRSRKTAVDTELRGLTKRSANQFETIEQLRSQSAMMDQRYQEHHTRINSVLQQRDSAFEQANALKGDLKRTRKHTKANEETIRNLRRERGAILMRNRVFNDSFPRIHNESLDYSKADQLSTEYGGTTKSDPIRGAVFVEPPRQRDDLKLIFGIAKVLEEKLNGFGIYTFKQIMEWDNKAIDKFSELLVFKDRIHRDGWLIQAARLYNQKSEKRVA